MNEDKMIKDIEKINLVTPQCNSCENLINPNECEVISNITSDILFNRIECHLYINNS